MPNDLNTRCFFRYEDGSHCKRWAQRGSRFCYNHQPQGEAGPKRYGYGSGHAAGDWPQLHPHARLAMPPGHNSWVLGPVTKANRDSALCLCWRILFGPQISRLRFAWRRR